MADNKGTTIRGTSGPKTKDDTDKLFEELSAKIDKQTKEANKLIKK
jgi:hypothetical protein